MSADTDFEKESGTGKFKESVNADVQNVFFSLDEFAEKRLINGKEIPVVVDDDKMNELVESKFTDRKSVV